MLRADNQKYRQDIQIEGGITMPSLHSNTCISHITTINITKYSYKITEACQFENDTCIIHICRRVLWTVAPHTKLWTLILKCHEVVSNKRILRDSHHRYATL